MSKLDCCAVCGSKDLKREENITETVKFKTSNGIKTLTVSGINMDICQKCGEGYLNPDDSKNYDLRLREALAEHRRKRGLLTGEEIKEIRKKYDLTQEELERLMGVGAKTVARWETYKSDQNRTADLLMRAIDKEGKKLIKVLDSEIKKLKPKKHQAA